MKRKQGRPRIDINLTLVNFRLKERQVKALNDMNKKTKISKSEIVRTALDEYFKKNSPENYPEEDDGWEPVEDAL